ncbi:MAG: TraX family protein [Alphaproteobacteria bacterium]
MKNLSQSLTSYDLLKTLAVVLMVVDHVGYFFFTEQEWFRVVGRLSMPVWFFLIGYARTRDVPVIFWLGGALLGVASLLSGEALLPLNILIALGVTRLVIDRVMGAALRGREAFLGVCFLLLLVAVPSVIVFEYGTLGLLFAMYGYLCRHKGDGRLSGEGMVFFAVGVVIAYVVFQSVLLGGIGRVQFLSLLGGVGALMVLLYCFAPREFDVRAGWARKPLQFCGRYTLEIYVFHVLAFKAIAPFVNPEFFTLFDVKIFPFGL